MKFAIIAAGEGSRLAAEGVKQPKPLVEVCGEPLIDRLIRIFMDNDAEEICVICNDATAQVSSHLVHIQRDGLKGRPVPLRFKVKSTPSSMHSFHELSQWLDGGVFCLTTVDTIFSEAEFKLYVEALKETTAGGKADGLMGVTDYVDDEKPLYVATDDSLNITGFLDASDDCPFVSAGVYGLASSSLSTLESCARRGESRMRNYQRALVADGRRLKAYQFSKVLDIDHATDIAKAERFIRDEAARG